MSQPSQVTRGAVLVLGMHRSGTSALTRGLEVLGVDLGGNLKPPVPGDNDKGFFEDWALSTINDDLLALRGGQWDSLFADAVGEGNRGLGELKLRALSAIETAFGQSDFFGFKDPRTCRTLPFWQDVFARAGVTPFYVIAFRNPKIVADSLQSRESFARERSYYLWLIHTLSAVKHSQGLPRVFVEYDELMTDPERVLNRIAGLIDDPRVTVSPRGLQLYQGEFLDLALQRHRSHSTHLELDDACSPFVRTVYELLRHETRRNEGDSESSSGDWAPILSAFEALTPHLNYLHKLDGDLRAAQIEHADAQSEVQHLRGVLETREGVAEAGRIAHEAEVTALRQGYLELNTAAAEHLAQREAELLRKSADLDIAAENERVLRDNYQAQVNALEQRLVAAQRQVENTERAWQAVLQETERSHGEALAFVQREAERLRDEAEAAYRDLLARALEQERAETARQLSVLDIVKLEEAERRHAAELEGAERRNAIALEEIDLRYAVSLENGRRREAALDEALAAARLEVQIAEDEVAALRAGAMHASAEMERLRASAVEAEKRAADAVERERREASARAATLTRELERLQGEHAARISVADAHAEALRQAHEAIAERLREVYASSSWRITKPLRAIKTAISGGQVHDAPPESLSVSAAVAPEPALPRTIVSGTRAHLHARRPRRVHFTICAKNYLPIARVCLETSQRFHPDAEHYLVLCDEVDQGYDPSDEPFKVIKVRDLPIPCFDDMALRYDVMEFNTAIKPFCFTHFFGVGADEVIYLDPDLFFLSRLDAVREAIADGAEAVLTPHINYPIEDDKRPNDTDMLRAGVYNLGFLALRRAPSAERFAVWWGERLRTGAVSDIARGLFTDQKWCDLLPCLVPNTRVLDRPGYNLAYWNLMHRPVGRSGETWTAAGEPISFVHFSGASFTDANVFSKHQNRYDANSIGALRELYDLYRDQVRAKGLGSGPSYRYSFDYDAQGRRIAPVLRQLYRDEIAGDTPSERPNLDRVISYANEPAPDLPRHAGLMISRLMHRIWKARPDLQAVFDLNAEIGQRGYLDWCNHTFGSEYGLDDRIYPKRPGAVVEERSDAPPSPSAAEPRPPTRLAAISRTVLSQSASLRPIYRHLPVELRQRMRVLLTRSAYSPAPSSAAPRHMRAPQQGAALVGYARGELGMGEHVRMTAAAMEAEGVPIGIVNVSENVLARQEDRRFDHLLSADADFRVNIFHVNADQLPIVCAGLGDRFLSGKKNIAYPFWELGGFPKDWMPQLNAMDEVWAPSRFIQDSLSEIDRPVVHMPVTVEVAPGYEKWRREDFGLPNDAFLFLFYFDLASFSSRKNPIGVVNAFKLAVNAISRTSRAAGLVVKVISAERFPREYQQLQEMTRSIPGVVLMPEVFSADKIHGLVNCTDAFVSLHRSEGFGRGPAEAMRLGKAAVATAYSGNMDYMNDDNSFPVPYSLRAVGADEYPYGAGQVWADPDVRAAGAIMARLISEPSLARDVGQRARAYMIEHHSQAAIGRRYAERLRAVGALS